MTDGLQPRDSDHARRLALADPDRRGSVPMGLRKDFTAQVTELVALRGDELREAFSAEESVRAYYDAIMAGVRARDRTCIIQYGKVMKLVDNEVRVLHEFVARTGAKSEAELIRGFQTAKGVEDLSPHEGAEKCVTWLEMYFNAYPDQRPSALKRLGGYVPV